MVFKRIRDRKVKLPSRASPKGVEGLSDLSKHGMINVQLQALGLSSKTHREKLMAILNCWSNIGHLGNQDEKPIHEEILQAVVTIFANVCFPKHPDTLLQMFPKDSIKDLKELKLSVLNFIQNQSSRDDPAILRSDKDMHSERDSSTQNVIPKGKRARNDASIAQRKHNSEVAKLQAERIKKNSMPFTIWNAVSSFASIQGKWSWEVVKSVLHILHANEIDCPWMRGEEIGVFGENPLHLALLCNEPSQEVTEMFHVLWKMCPKLRCGEYQHKEYERENILHIAIVKGYNVDFLECIRSCHDTETWNTLIAGQVEGNFFRDPANCCNFLGQSPLFFAACVGRQDVFKYLSRNGPPAMLRAKVENDNNLLHLLILREKQVGSLAGEFSAECDDLLKTFEVVQETLKSHLDSIEHQSQQDVDPSEGIIPKQSDEKNTPLMERDCKTMFDTLLKQKNKDGMTPLALAAAQGSARMFAHIFNGQISIAWKYGPVTCKKVCIEELDVAIHDTNGADRNLSILEILCEEKRKDILSVGCIDKYVDRKWQKYGSRIFRKRMYLSAFVAFLTILLPMIKVTSFSWTVLHSFNYLLIAFFTHTTNKKGSSENKNSASENKNSVINEIMFGSTKHYDLSIMQIIIDFASEFVFFVPFIFMSTFKSIQNVVTKLKSALNTESLLVQTWSEICRWEEIKQFTTAPTLSIILLMSFWLQALVHPCISQVQLFNFSIFHILAQITTLFAQTSQLTLYAALGMICFSDFMSLLLAIDREYGLYLQMLLNITSKDLPYFFAIYATVLLMFSFCHFLARNELYSGVSAAADSTWGIFSAVVGNVHNQSSNLPENSLVRYIVTGITMMNYFLVTVVLVNILIAKITYTFKATSIEAEGTRKLRRAELLVEMDKTMTTAQREKDENTYWYCGFDKRRFIPTLFPAKYTVVPLTLDATSSSMTSSLFRAGT